MGDAKKKRQPPIKISMSFDDAMKQIIKAKPLRSNKQNVKKKGR